MGKVFVQSHYLYIWPRVVKRIVLSYFIFASSFFLSSGAKLIQETPGPRCSRHICEGLCPGNTNGHQILKRKPNLGANVMLWPHAAPRGWLLANLLLFVSIGSAAIDFALMSEVWHDLQASVLLPWERHTNTHHKHHTHTFTTHTPHTPVLWYFSGIHAQRPVVCLL